MGLRSLIHLHRKEKFHIIFLIAKFNLFMPERKHKFYVECIAKVDT